MPGSSFSDISEKDNQRGIAVYNDGGGGREISAKVGENEVVVINRTQKFSSLEKKVVEEFLKLTEIFDDIDSKYYSVSVLNNISHVITNSIIDNDSDFKIVNDIIRCLENWAAETYEGANISASVMYDPSKNDEGILKYSSFINADFAKVITNGFDTYVTVNNKYEVCSYSKSEDSDSDNYKVPYRYTSLSKHAIDGKILFILNRNGELLIIKDNELVFAKRRGSWKVFNHDTTIRQIAGGGKTFSEEIRRAVYATCLDVSFARTGGSIGLINKTKQEEALNELLKSEDNINSPGNDKTHFITQFKNSSFSDIDRLFRQEMSGIDGATLLDREGKVISFGAIISIIIEKKVDNETKSEVTGGGRTAASMQLSKYGIGTKISEDGKITVFKNEEEIFSIA